MSFWASPASGVAFLGFDAHHQNMTIDHQHHADGSCQHAPPGAFGGPLAAVLVVTAAYAIIEAVGGWWTGSLALLADAGHMLGDVASLALALFASWIGRRPADSKRTFGYLRAETLAALANALTLVAVSGGIVYEAVQRFNAPAEVAGAEMLVVATIGLAVNAWSAWILHGSHQHNLNVRAAWLHVLSDLLGSAAAIAAALVILVTGWSLADPVMSLGIAFLILVGTWRLLSETVHVLLQGAPANIPLAQVESRLLACTGVVGLRQVHLWTLGSGAHVLTAHVVVEPTADLAETSEILQRLRDVARQEFHIESTTFQPQIASEKSDAGEPRTAESTLPWLPITQKSRPAEP